MSEPERDELDTTDVVDDTSGDDQRAEVTLVTRAQPIVHEVARKLHRQMRQFVPLDELVSMGNEALVGLVRNYDPAAAPFEAYLRRFLRWAMISKVRRSEFGYAGAMMARSVGAVDRLRDTTEPKLLREPQTATAAHAEFRARLTARVAAMAIPLIAAHGQALSQGAFSEENRTPEQRALRKCASLKLRSLVAKLSDARERAIIERTYFGDEPFAAVADDLGLSKWQACRLHKKATVRLARLAKVNDIQTTDFSD